MAITKNIGINDSVIKVWADILKKVKNSKLIINSSIFKNSFTKKEFENRFFKFGKSIIISLQIPSLGHDETN